MCEAQQEIARQAAKEPASFPTYSDYSQDVFDALAAEVSPAAVRALTIASKKDRETETDRIKTLAAEKLAAQFEGREKETSGAFRALDRKSTRLNSSHLGI